MPNMLHHNSLLKDILAGRMKGIQTRSRKRPHMMSDNVVKNMKPSKERQKIG